MSNNFITKFFINFLNAISKKQHNMPIKYSIKSEKFLKSLKKIGFIRGFEILKEKKEILVLLKYNYFTNPSINSLKTIFKVNMLTPITKNNANSIYKDFNVNCSNTKNFGLTFNELGKNLSKKKSQCLILLK